MLGRYYAILYFFLATCATYVSGLDFTGSDWVWTEGRAADGVTYPPGNVTLRKKLGCSGKTPVSTNILIVADDAYTLYVNGLKLGGGNNFQRAQRYCAPLVKKCNVFAVSAQNVGAARPGNAAGLLAAAQIRYSDGSSETMVTDGQWRAITGTPAGFEQVAFDDSTWPAAFVEGRWPTANPWGNTIIMPPDNQVTDRELSLDSAYWIWTNEVTGPPSPAPIGARAFRKTIVIPNGQVAAQARILVAADNEHTVYVNGKVVGSGQSFSVAQRYTVNFPPTDRVVIAVFARNVPPGGPAGLILAAQIVTCDCAENMDLVTNESWKYSLLISPDFIEPSYDDSKWLPAFVSGREGVAPWGNTTIPSTNSPQSAPLSGAPAAPPASVVT